MMEKITQGDQDAAELVELIADEMFDGWLPDAAREIAWAVAKVCIPDGTPVEIRDAFAMDLLLPALHARIAAQDAVFLH